MPLKLAQYGSSYKGSQLYQKYYTISTSYMAAFLGALHVSIVYNDISQL